MGEAFRQSLYVCVGGILFCVALAIMMMLFNGIIEMNNNIHMAHETVYDLNREYYFEER
ncbi:MAG: hypothetical protein K6E85_10020 [Lachnospiraceae bacterium]|nr:hypothetical protein [Lachnospiraceae bacterium]